MERRVIGCAVLVLFFLCIAVCHGGHAQGPFQGLQDAMTNTSWEDQVNKSKVNIDAVANEIFPYVVEGSSELDVSVDCMTALLKTFKAFRDLRGWAVRLMDASGKLPEGLLEGRMASIGSYDECLDLIAEYKTQELYRGKYCTVFLSSGHNVQEMFNNETDASAHLSTLLRHPKRMTRIVYRVSPESRKFRLGVCVPSVCTLDDVQNVVAHTSSKSIGAKTQVSRCVVKEDVSISGLQVFLIITLCVLVSVILVATILDMRVEDNAQKALPGAGCLTNCLLSFSFARNLRRLTDPVEPPELGAAQGVQAISMAWLICGHTYFLTENTHMFSGLLRAYDNISSDIFFSPFVNYTLAANTFFLATGLFLAYKCELYSYKSVFSILLQKYFRMTPPFLAVLSVLLLLPLTNDGPFWQDYAGTEIERCSAVWWTNLFYISNFWNAESMCLFVTWYPATVIQFTIIGLIFLIVIKRNAKVGYSSVLGFALAGCVVTGAITFAKDLPPGNIFEPNYREVERLSTWIYHKPYTHLGSFCVGLGLGCLLSHFDKNRLSKLAYAMGWVASLTTTSVLFHCGFGWSVEPASPAGASLYAALHRTLWALAVAWVLYACCTLHARLLNEWLSWGPLKVVGRLSYCMLLVHPLVIVSQKSQNRHITFFSHFDMMHLFFGHYAVTLVLSFFVHLGVEEPFAQLGELLSSCEITCPPRLKQLTQNIYAGMATQLHRRERQQRQAASGKKEAPEGGKKAQQPSQQQQQQQQLDNHHTDVAIDVDVGRQLENGTEVAVIKENGKDTSHVARDAHRDSVGSPEAAV
ncbi:O-acyltransferase like protein-like [Dermacentor albipictus]|uniref:O-acyltransferase like protein-like n=1 Tax=Dermacentor albipictus TaxID=60249 RepID=UPI0031FE1EF2